MSVKQKLAGKFRHGDVVPYDRISIPGLDINALNQELARKRFIYAAVGRLIVAPDEICTLSGLLEARAHEFDLKVENIPLQPALLLSNPIKTTRQRADSLEKVALRRLRDANLDTHAQDDDTLTATRTYRKMSKAFVRLGIEFSPARTRIDEERSALQGIRGIGTAGGAFRVALVGVQGEAVGRFIEEVSPIMDSIPSNQIIFGPFGMLSE